MTPEERKRLDEMITESRKLMDAAMAGIPDSAPASLISMVRTALDSIPPQECLEGPSYEIEDDGKTVKKITFSPCGVVSHNPNDVRERYCGRCHRYIDLVHLCTKLRKEHFPDADKE